MVTRRAAGWAAALWGVLFAIPSFYWALGGTWGARSTISPSLVELAERRDTGFLVVLWVTGALKLVGGLLGWALTKDWGPRIRLLLLWAGWGAGVLLAWHGLLFVAQGLLVRAGVIDIAADLRPVSRWYTYLWGPWFLAGGLAFVVAARRYLGSEPGRRALVASAVGGLGALLLSAGSLAAGVG